MSSRPDGAVRAQIQPEPAVSAGGALRLAIRDLPAPWHWWTRLRLAHLERGVAAAVAGGEPLATAVEQVLCPYHNRLTLVAYGLLLGAVSLNAYVVTLLADRPALAAFAATFGGTLAGALGFQVLARLQAWAKQLSSNGSLRVEQIPFNATALEIWRRSQQMKSDLTRDGRNIRKDSWLQLHPRLERALALTDERDALEAVADALIDHRQSFAEVGLDVWLAREFHRNLKARFANEASFQAIRQVFRVMQPEHRLALAELDRLLTTLLKPESWRGNSGGAALTLVEDAGAGGRDLPQSA